MELAHAHRIAMMGQLTASIPHEVNQPIAAMVTNAQAALRWLDRHRTWKRCSSRLLPSSRTAIERATSSTASVLS
jgi:C4-dicarboxylate-specific signal transduction histidine kinase